MIVGIDLGTSTSEVAVFKNGRPEIIRNVKGSERGVLPSVVGIGRDGKVIVGEHAESWLLLRPEHAKAEVKREMGRGERILLAAEEYTPQEISAVILRHLKEEAEKYLGCQVEEAVITVPAYFDDSQRRATREAGELAGLSVRRLIHEPTAAAISYGLERPGFEEKILVYDLGGGTLDVTILELSEGVFDVMCSTGNSALGGKDFDELLVEHLAGRCRDETGVELTASPRGRVRLKAKAKKAKEDLSTLESVLVVLDNIGLSPDGEPLDFEHQLSRSTFEALIAELVNQTDNQITEALAEARLTPDDIYTVLMIGGSTRIPLVQRFVSERLGGKELSSSVNPEEAVALGAAIVAGIETQEVDPGTAVVTDVSPWTLGIEVVELVDGALVHGRFSPLIMKNSTIPRTESDQYATAADWQTGVWVRVYQGNSQVTAENRPVGHCILDGIPPKPAGAELLIELTYNLSGEVDVICRHIDSGMEARSRMKPDRIHLSDVEKAVAQERLERLWTGEAAPVDASWTETATGEWMDSPHFPRVSALVRHAEGQMSQLSSDARPRVVHQLETLRAALASGDEDRIKRCEEELIDLLFELE